MRRPTYALTVSILSIILATSGTAWAALTVTGKQIKDSTLTHQDFKNGSLAQSDVATASRTALRVAGAKGIDGPKGVTGDTGAQGKTGAQGAPAKNAFAWANHTENTILTMNSQNNADPDDWYARAGTGDWTNPDAGYGTVKIELADGQNDGLLVLDRESDVLVTADITAWHEDTDVHSRLECRLRITNIATNQQATVGHPVLVSTEQYRHVKVIGLVGGITRSAGTYSVRAECRDLDLSSTSYQKWFVAKGNMSVLSAGNWR